MSYIVPRYYQIKHEIKNWIVDGEFGPGDKIPSENKLAERFGVSRLTIRQSISQLIQEGFLISRKGEGTFVTADKELINSFSLEFTGFMDDLFYQTSKSKTKSADMKEIEAPKRIKERLELKEDERVIKVRRVRFMNGKPFALTTNYLTLEIGRKIIKKDLLVKPLLQILELDLGVNFTEAFQTIEASFADQDLAEMLEVPFGSPILLVERIMYTARRKPFELVQSQYRGDMYKYIARLKPVKRKQGPAWVSNSE